jgi:hypothetical protein
MELRDGAPISERHAHGQVATEVVAAIPATSKAVMATAGFREGIASFLQRRQARFTGR